MTTWALVEKVFSRDCLVRVFLAVAPPAAFAFDSAAAEAADVIQLINGAGQNAADALNGSGTFTTSFKGINDVTITKLAGTMNQSVLDSFPAASATSNNPAYVSEFVGSSANGTGDGTAGTFALLQETAGASLQFDFATPLAAGDRIFVGDVDTSEVYSITAYALSGGNYVPVSLTGWALDAFTGETGQQPDGQWPSWDPTGGGSFTGTLSSNTNGGLLTEPLDVLTPDQAISRVVITEDNGPGTPALQFFSESSVPEPTSWALMVCGFGLIGHAMRKRQSKPTLA